jgi:hypothetical protein
LREAVGIRARSKVQRHSRAFDFWVGRRAVGMGEQRTSSNCMTSAMMRSPSSHAFRRGTRNSSRRGTRRYPSPSRCAS